jgi:hypothetical protein
MCHKLPSTVSCQQFSWKMKRFTMSLQHIIVEQPFSQCGLDFIGPINQNSSKGHMHILTTTNYFTKWQEVMELKRVDSEELIKFLKYNILSRFCVPYKFITNNGLIFISSNFTEIFWRIWNYHGSIIKLLSTRKWSCIIHK